MKPYTEGERIIPRTRSNHGVVEHQPDVPSVETGRLIALRAFVPRGCSDTYAGLIEIEPAVDKRGLVPTRGVNATPLYRRPLIPVFTTNHGGGRTYGGGTSPEALRRAKQKAKQ